jgi:hypothetical protein
LRARVKAKAISYLSSRAKPENIKQLSIKSFVQLAEKAYINAGGLNHMEYKNEKSAAWAYYPGGFFVSETNCFKAGRAGKSPQMPG